MSHEFAPLSYGQRAMWFLWNVHPSGAEYNIPTAWYIRTHLDVTAVRRALQQVVDRHAMLRTTYGVQDGEPVQHVHSDAEVWFMTVDAAGWDDAMLSARVNAEVHQPFDLTCGPLMRVHLFSRTPEDHILLFVIHHICGDLWTYNIILDEFGQLYQADITGAQIELPPAQAFTDYVHWQQEMLSTPEGAAHSQYWLSELAGIPVLDLPTDHPRPPVQTNTGAVYPFTVDADLIKQVRATAKREGVTFFSVLLAAFYALLHRYSGQEDLAVGSPRYGRPSGFERTTGFFVNSSALRIQLSSETPFSDLLVRVRQALLGSKEHGDFPFSLVVERLAQRRDPSRSPVFQAAFTYEKAPFPGMDGVGMAIMGVPGATINLSGLIVESFAIEQRTARYDLDFMVEELDGTLQGVIWYNSDLWDHATIGRMAGHYQTLLTSVIQNPEQKLADLPLLTPSERHQLLVEWNNTAATYPLDKCLHELFEQQAEATPDAIAVSFENSKLTYRELNERANQLAHYLRRLGLHENHPVGICIERSLEMVVAIFATLKAGGAYLPMDPAYPRERLAFMLEDSGMRFLLTHRYLAETLPLPEDVGEETVHVICLEADWHDIAHESDQNPNLPVKPSDQAYVIFTSGSTGRPKGAMIPHRAICNHMHWMQSTFPLGSGDRVLQKTPFSFDASVWEFFAPLLVGAELVMARPGGHANPSYLVRTIAKRQITTLQLVPSMLGVLVEEPGLEECRSLRRLFCGGEALSAELVSRLHARLSDATVINLYGPTECTIDSTYCIWQPGMTGNFVPIGRPVDNLQAYILDARQVPVPVGIPGELYIAGVGLGRGYLNRPDLTADRFMPNPFGQPGERMYKTGDLVRYLPDGTIDYLGRIDHQVKIRGFRIELGEIESVMREHAAVRDALVTAQADAVGEKRLVAYVVPVETGALSAVDLRSYLAAKLPNYMVPNHCVFLETWPLTPSGKVDRRALPQPQETSAGMPALPLETEFEQKIAAIWQEVLGIGEVGAEDNFFEIGGHSLGIIKVESKLKQKLGIDISTMDLFRFPTIRSLAHHLSKGQAKEPPALQPESGASPARASVVHKSVGAEAIAIVGMAGRFPGASTIEEFWRNLAGGVESITELSDDELLEAGVDPVLLRDPRYVKRKGLLDDTETFDAPFFGYPPREAQIMDPQQRMFLELAWQALEHAGYTSGSGRERIGVFAGTGTNGYLLHHLATYPESAAELFQTVILNDKDFLSTRVAYKLNLKGPAITVQSACSTSLLAVHLACQSLLNGECDMSLAGGVSLEVPHRTGYLYQEGHILSPDGHCRAFDADAKGTVRGSGGALVVLKRLTDAVAAGDTIWAVIKGSAINNDGALKVGYTAPSTQGQADVIARALDRAGVDPRTITYVEAHGTGTPLGDPIEVAALTEVYRQSTPDSGYCALGSVKTNVGHLDTAAGVTGLIKAALALHHQVIPPTLHFTTPNPKLDLGNSPFYVNTTPVQWQQGDQPRRAAVSSFGIGGTNAHVVLEEAPPSPSTSSGCRYELLTLSAKSERALATMTTNLAQHLASHHELALADVAYTLQTGRTALAQRRIVVCSDAADAVDALQTQPRLRVYTGTPVSQRSVTFLFPGQGLQHVNMGRELYEAEPEFRRQVDACAATLQPLLGFDLRGILYPAPEQSEEAAQRLNQTAVTQPAIFVVEYALARLLVSWGIEPQAMMGHSLGEYVAACLAGVMSLQDALKLVAARGQLVQRLPAAAMLAVELTPEALQPWLNEALDLAVINAPDASVAAGPVEAIEVLQNRLKGAGINCHRVRTSHAFHSAQLDPILPDFRKLMQAIHLQAPQIPYITNVTGTWVTSEQATDPDHWVRHLRHTVRFADGMTYLLKEPRLFLEVGPGQTLTAMIQRYPGKERALLAAPALGNPQQKQSDLSALLTAVGRLWITGVPLDWQRLYADQTRRRVPLPVYPFDRHRYWIEARPPVAPGEATWMFDVAAAADVQAEYSSLPVQVERRPEAHIVPPRDEVELELVEVFEEVLGVTPIGVTEGFFDLGGTSLSALSVMSRIERVFGSRLPISTLLEGQTVETLARILRSEKTIRSNELVGIQTSGTLPPIFCVHPYGGNVTGYFQLARCLGPDQPIYGLQARGLHGEMQPRTRIEEMAAHYIQILKSKQPFGPYILLGHSMGGNIAYEMARQLRAEGDEVALLAMLDSKAYNPSLGPIYDNPEYGAINGMDWLSDEVKILGILFPKLEMDWEQLRTVAREEQWLQVLDQAVHAGVLPVGFGQEQIQQVIAVTKANDEALRAYVPDEHHGPVLLFAGEEGFGQQFGDEYLGWRSLAPGLELIKVPGDHFTLVEQPNVEILAARLKSNLENCYRHLHTYWSGRLRTLSGRPARIVLADGSIHLGTYFHTPEGGLVDRLTLPAVLLDCVRAEIITPDGLLRFDARIRGGDASERRLLIDIPSQVETVQRRFDRRVEIALPTTLTADGTHHNCLMINLSAGGCAIQLELGWQPAVGDRVSLALVAPGHFNFGGVTATVVRSGQDGNHVLLGVQFENLSAPQHETLAAYCRELTQDPSNAGS